MWQIYCALSIFSNSYSVGTSTCRGLEPLIGPTMPAASSWSTIRPARLNPISNLRCMVDAEPC